MTPSFARTGIVPGVILAFIGLAAMAPGSAAADADCDRHASPTGSDTAPGTAAAPVRSVAHLAEILGPGEDGCLPAGATFTEPIGTFIIDRGAGTPTAPVTIRTADPDGEPATVKGQLWIKPEVHDLAFERIRFLDSPANADRGTMLIVHGDRVALRETEISFPRGICLNVGNRAAYVAGDTGATAAAAAFLIERSRIHDCGTEPRVVESLRASGQSGVHGLYLINAPGAVIRDNFIYDNVSRGVQLWPDTDGALVEHNVIDGNGSNVNIGSSAPYGHFSEGNRFAQNVISNAVLRSVYDRPWGPGDTEAIVGNFPPGGSYGNVLEGNCVHQSDPGLHYGGSGYEHGSDLFADPLYVDRPRHDYRLRGDSACSGKGPRGAVIGGTEEEPSVPDFVGSPTPILDTTPPRLRLLGKRRRVLRAGRRAAIRVRLSERTWLTVRIRRLGTKRVRILRRALRGGLARLVLPQLAAGRYRVVLIAVDAQGNRSRRATLLLGVRSQW